MTNLGTAIKNTGGRAPSDACPESNRSTTLAAHDNGTASGARKGAILPGGLQMKRKDERRRPTLQDRKYKSYFWPGSRCPGCASTASCLALRQTLATAIVQKGTRSSPGTSLAKNDGRNSQCHPSRRVMMAATPRSRRSSAGDIAPSTTAGKTASWRMSATIAMSIARRNSGPGEMVILSSDIGNLLAPY